MAYINIDLEDFDLREILSEISCRYKSKWRIEDKQVIEQFLKDMVKIPIPEERNITASVADQIKMDYFIENFDKIKLTDLENITQ